MQQLCQEVSAAGLRVQAKQQVCQIPITPTQAKILLTREDTGVQVLSWYHNARPFPSLSPRQPSREVQALMSKGSANLPSPNHRHS